MIMVKRKHTSIRLVKNRFTIEVIGLLIIGLLVYLQRNILPEAFDLIKSAPPELVLIGLGLWWLTIPLSALNYLVLALPKKLKFWRTSAVHLSGAGPGKLVPGGVGGMGIGTLYLKKAGYKLDIAAAIATSNNFTGFLANTLLLAILIPLNSDNATRVKDSVSYQKLGLVFIFIAFCITVFWGLLRVEGINKLFNLIKLQLLSFWKKLLKQPRRIATVLLSATIITIIHATILFVSAKAVGLDLGWVDAVFALSIGVVVGAILPTPGGIGAVEAGITSTLIVLGFPPAEAAGAGILYRISTFWQPLIPGIFAYFILRRKHVL